ncbi:tyrosine-type recombinase/integrase [Paraburkholderia aspalathi]|uniref:tyrosine-type recombinase/integrase n=1 Tax=Paraburkholderia aspalathi TaxID=1324617 RepID=UPI003C97EA4C
MRARFHVVTVRHPNGERLPILLDGDRQPIAWINSYVIRRLRPRLAVSSLVKTLFVLGYVWQWAETDAFPLEARLVSGEGLTPDEIVSRVYPWLRRNFRIAGEVRKLVVSPGTVVFRLNVVLRCVAWHLECAMATMPAGSQQIVDARERLAVIRRSFATAARTRLPTASHAAPLTEMQLQRLLQVCHPDSCENPWKRPYRERNFLIVLILATLGIRRGELLKLRVSDCLLSRAIPEVRVERSPDDPADPRMHEPQVKTESRHLPCDVSLARYLNEYICKIRRLMPGASRCPFLLLSRTGQPMSLVRVNGLIDQIAHVNPEFSDLHPHCLRSTCATRFREAARRNGVDEERIDKDMMYFFGWRSADSVTPYIEAAIRREACEIGLSYQAMLFGRVAARSDA